LIEGRKVCGILMEISAEVDCVDWAVVGLGINANIDVSGFPVEWRSTSLRQELGQEVSRIDLIQKILLEVEETYQSMHSKDLYEEWRRRSVTLGKQVRITSATGDLSGEAIDLAEDGSLLIRAEDKIKRVLAGDCIHLRAPGRHEEEKGVWNCQGYSAVHFRSLQVFFADGVCRALAGGQGDHHRGFNPPRYRVLTHERFDQALHAAKHADRGLRSQSSISGPEAFPA